MPGWCMSRANHEMPLCFGTSTSVRAINMPRSAKCPPDVHTFWPFTMNTSPSRTAEVRMPARSDPASGSLNSWHQDSWPGHDRPEVPRLLLVRAVGHDRRAGQHHADSAGRTEGAGVGDRLADDGGVAPRQVAAEPRPRATSEPPSGPRRGAPTTPPTVRSGSQLLANQDSISVVSSSLMCPPACLRTARHPTRPAVSGRRGRRVSRPGESGGRQGAELPEVSKTISPTAPTSTATPTTTAPASDRSSRPSATGTGAFGPAAATKATTADSAFTMTWPIRGGADRDPKHPHVGSPFDRAAMTIPAKPRYSTPTNRPPAPDRPPRARRVPPRAPPVPGVGR